MLLLLLVGVVVGNTYLTSLGGDGGGYRSNDCLADGWLNVWSYWGHNTTQKTNLALEIVEECSYFIYYSMQSAFK